MKQCDGTKNVCRWCGRVDKCNATHFGTKRHRHIPCYPCAKKHQKERQK